jgi:ribosome-associated protein
MIPVTDAIAIDDRDVKERFIRASGPGGQNVNKVATAVELRFDIRASSLPAEVKQRLEDLAGRRATADGLLVIDSRRFRTQARNREAARARLVALVRKAALPPARRVATRPTTAAREERLARKKRRGTLKGARATRPGLDD